MTLVIHHFLFLFVNRLYLDEISNIITSHKLNICGKGEVKKITIL